MISYSKPLCKTGSTFVKSRCECKTLSKNKKTSRKTLKIRKSSKYNEEWAVSGKYMSRMPSQEQLKVRRRRIDEVYKLHKMIKKFKPDEISPDEWEYPPQYCYLKQLLNVIKYMKHDLKIYSKNFV